MGALLQTSFGPGAFWVMVAYINNVESSLTRVTSACKQKGKAAGMLLSKPEQIEPFVAQGFTFIAIGSDGALVTDGMFKLDLGDLAVSSALPARFRVVRALY